MSRLEVAPLVETPVGARPDGGARPVAEVEADLVSHHRRQHQHGVEPAHVEGRHVMRVPGICQDAGGDEERVAGKEEADQEPGLGEYDADQGQDPAGLDEPRQPGRRRRPIR